jgi:hypothetical protein
MSVPHCIHNIDLESMSFNRYGAICIFKKNIILYALFLSQHLDHLPVLRWLLCIIPLFYFMVYSQCEKNMWIVAFFWYTIIVTSIFFTTSWFHITHSYMWKTATRILACLISCPASTSPAHLGRYPKSDLFERVRVVNHNWNTHNTMPVYGGSR